MSAIRLDQKTIQKSGIINTCVGANGTTTEIYRNGEKTDIFDKLDVKLETELIDKKTEETRQQNILYYMDLDEIQETYCQYLISNGQGLSYIECRCNKLNIFSCESPLCKFAQKGGIKTCIDHIHYCKKCCTNLCYRCYPYHCNSCDKIKKHKKSKGI